MALDDPRESGSPNSSPPLPDFNDGGDHHGHDIPSHHHANPAHRKISNASSKDAIKYVGSDKDNSRSRRGSGRRFSLGPAIEDSGSDTVGKQVELESDNAIKYRTCSWQKVCQI